jgi:hypothetical protein
LGSARRPGYVEEAVKDLIAFIVGRAFVDGRRIASDGGLRFQLYRWASSPRQAGWRAAFLRRLQAGNVYEALKDPIMAIIGLGTLDADRPPPARTARGCEGQRGETQQRGDHHGGDRCAARVAAGDSRAHREDRRGARDPCQRGFPRGRRAEPYTAERAFRRAALRPRGRWEVCAIAGRLRGDRRARTVRRLRAGRGAFVAPAPLAREQPPLSGPPLTAAWRAARTWLAS